MIPRLLGLLERIHLEGLDICCLIHSNRTPGLYLLPNQLGGIRSGQSVGAFSSLEGKTVLGLIDRADNVYHALVHLARSRLGAQASPATETMVNITETTNAMYLFIWFSFASVQLHFPAWVFPTRPLITTLYCDPNSKM